VTGYGLVEVGASRQVKLIEAGTIEPAKKDVLPERLQKIYRNLQELLEQYSPDVVVVEKIFSHYKHPATACIMGHTRGVILLLAAQNRVKIVEHGVKRIRKSLIGQGSASKQQTRDAVSRILKIDPSRMTLDTSDALALALGYAFMLRFSIQASGGHDCGNLR